MTLQDLRGLRRLYSFKAENYHGGYLIKMNIDGCLYGIHSGSFPELYQHDINPPTENSIPIVIRKASITLLSGQIILCRNSFVTKEFFKL